MTYKFSALDIESTGIDPATARTVELGYAIFDDGQCAQTGSMLVNPGMKIDPGASDVHGVEDEHVKHSPTIQHAWQRLPPLPEVIILYNGLDYDLPVLRRELAPVDPMAGHIVFDPFVWVKWFFPGLRHKALADISRALGVRKEGFAHSADGDCVKTGLLWLRLIELGFVPADVHEAARVQAIIHRAVTLERAAFEGILYWRRQDMTLCVGQGSKIGQPLSVLWKKAVKQEGTKKHATEAVKQILRKVYKHARD